MEQIGPLGHSKVGESAQKRGEKQSGGSPLIH